MQLAASIFFLMTFASLRFADLRGAQDIWSTDTALFGRSLDHKDKGGAITAWATPRVGLKSRGGRCAPALALWQCYRPDNPDPTGPKFHFLFPYFPKDWTPDFARAGANGAAQAALARLEERCGLSIGRSLRPPRAWFATCAAQLAFMREDRVTLGRRSTGSVMPDRYDRGVCVTELRLRDEILGLANDGWRPQKAFAVPNAATKSTRRNKVETKTAVSDASSAPETSSMTKLTSEVDIAGLYV